MGRYSDEELRKCKKITMKIAADYLGISPTAIGIGMRNNLLPIGIAIHNEERDRRFSESWSYHIVAERLIAYNHGTISEIHIQNVEKGLDRIIEEFTSLRQELLFILSENEEAKN